MRNAIAYHDCTVVSYNKADNTFIAKSKLTGWKYKVSVNANGDIHFKGIVPHISTN